MNHCIVEKEPFRLVVLKKNVPIIFEGVNPDIVKMYELLTPEVIKKLKALSDIEPVGIISASTNFSEGRMEEKGCLDYYIGIATSNNGTLEFDVLEIEAVEGPEILWNESQDTKNSNYRSEIWIPVRKKNIRYINPLCLEHS